MANEFELPYVGIINGGVRPGTQIVIKGSVMSMFADKGFQVNLVCGHNGTVQHCKNADVAFQLRTQFGDERMIALNSKANGQWGVEDRHYQMVVKKGAPFEIVITVEENSYRVLINGTNYANYESKVASRDIGLMFIKGRVNIDSIAYNQVDVQRCPQPAPRAPLEYYQPPPPMPQPPPMAYAPPPPTFVQSYVTVPQPMPMVYAPQPMPMYQPPPQVYATAPLYPSLPPAPFPQPRFFESQPQPPPHNPYHQGPYRPY